ncbi:MAG: hypothetical protein NZ772_05690 [Cyanobacteria bacterium]|nr:hypothetical protein [Cyanobacteriota bacterium]MDW8201005.1 hypothetical protein [Cyanobacteriota bacterium SKYGB_h_bin112]
MQFFLDKAHWTGFWLRLPILVILLGFAGLATSIAGINWWRTHQREHNLSAVHSALQPLKASLADPQLLTVDVPFEICAEATDWTRPSPQEQEQELQKLPRYATELNREPLRSLYQRLYNQSVFSFTAYGISLRLEPLYFSGLWTVQSILRDCYDPNRIAQLNNGQLAEVWVLLHRVVSVQWDGSRYVMTVEPTSRGVQFIQFPRFEHDPTLPLQVLTREGLSLDVFSNSLVELSRTQ